MSSNEYTKRIGHFPGRVAAANAPTLTVITRTASTAITAAVRPGLPSGPVACSVTGGRGGGAGAAAVDGTVGGTVGGTGVGTGGAGGDGTGGTGATAAIGGGGFVGAGLGAGVVGGGGVVGSGVSGAAGSSTSVLFPVTQSAPGKGIPSAAG
jgi:hypothetical protein